MLGQGHGRPTLNALWLWVSFGLLFLTVRQLVRSGVEQRALVSVVVALAVGLSAFGIYQTVHIYPQQRAAYAADPDGVLARAGTYAPPGSPQRRHFEDRLASTEPTGPFALTNSLAGFLAPCLVLLVGLAVPLWRSWADQLRSGGARALDGCPGAGWRCADLPPADQESIGILGDPGRLGLPGGLQRGPAQLSGGGAGHGWRQVWPVCWPWAPW